MKVFLSSTLIDLVAEREAVLKALRRKRQSVLAMEDFLATPSTSLETALKHLSESDLMILVIGFKAGSLLPGNSGMTYTSAEYAEGVRLGRHVLPFVKVRKRWFWSKRREWLNKERSTVKAEALAKFRDSVGSSWTWETFSTPDQLALAVIQSLEKWETEGRPGARKTFASAADFFASKAPQAKTPILDFTTSLFGRETEIQVLNSFLTNDRQSVCIVSGRGGIGKSKVLHDWTKTICDKHVVFLKDEPLWHEDSDKEVPTGPVVIVVDDAHRSQSMGRVAQLFKELRRRRQVKLVLSTRPGGTAMLTQPLYRDLDPSEIVSVPELQQLSKEQARALAREVLGEKFAIYAESLAEIAGNTPLVIVAGGRLIASQQVHPGELSNLEHFRSTIFTRFLDELCLEGPMFAVTPTRPLLDLIAAIGPVDVNDEAFLVGAEKLLGRRRDEILSTLDALGDTGIITRRARKYRLPIETRSDSILVRVLPDVLSDFILEDRCVGKYRQSTQYADHLYKLFAGHFRNLMRNLSELDWRLEKGGYGLDLLTAIWQQVEYEFLNTDEYGRHRIFDELSPAAFYQPDHILRLINLALLHPIALEGSNGNRHRAGQAYVLEAIPRLLEAVAYHPAHITKAVDLLWDLSKAEKGRSSDSGAAKAVLKRLASYNLHGWPFFNFAMLLQSIRLSRLPDAFEQEFTPFALIDMLLERDGEFTEYNENAVSFGGFGLNIAAVGLLRQNALEFLEFSTWSETNVLAVKAVRLLGSLLHGNLTRVGRVAGKAEIEWQNEERLHALEILSRRLQEPAGLVVRAQVYNAIRSGTGINCPAPVRDAAHLALAKFTRSAALVIFDAVCTREGDLPILTKEAAVESWDLQLRHMMQEAHDALSGIAAPASRAALLITDVKLAGASKLEPHGFARLVQLSSADTEFLSTLADQLLEDEQSDELAGQLSVVLDILHSCAPLEFHSRAKSILASKKEAHVRAAAAALRVYSDNATTEDINQIKAFLIYREPWVKSLALQAIAYMGKNIHLQKELLDAALSVDISGDVHVAVSFVEVFGPYGVPLSLLQVLDVSRLLPQFLHIQDLGANQGELAGFLSRLAMLYPDHVLDFLLKRLAIEGEQRKNKNWGYRSLNLVYGDVSFMSLAAGDRLRLALKCLATYFASDSEEENHAKLFWIIGGTDVDVLSLLLDACDDNDTRRVKQIAALIRYSPISVALSQPDFAERLLAKTSGNNQQQLINVFVENAFRYPSGPFTGEPNDYVGRHNDQIRTQIERFPSSGNLAALASALKRQIG